MERRRTTRLEMRGRCQRPSTKCGLNASAPCLSRRRLILRSVDVDVGVDWCGPITRKGDGGAASSFPIALNVCVCAAASLQWLAAAAVRWCGGRGGGKGDDDQEERRGTALLARPPPGPIIHTYTPQWPPIKSQDWLDWSSITDTHSSTHPPTHTPTQSLMRLRPCQHPLADSRVLSARNTHTPTKAAVESNH